VQPRSKPKDWNTRIKIRIISIYLCKGKEKQSHYRLGQALRIPGGWDSHISRQSVYEGGKVFSLTHRPFYSLQEIFLILISVRGWANPKAIVWPEGLGQWKTSVTPLGIAPATFRLVALCPKIGTAVPNICGPSLCNLLCRPAPRILRLLTDFKKICAPPPV